MRFTVATIAAMALILSAAATPASTQSSGDKAPGRRNDGSSNTGANAGSASRRRNSANGAPRVASNVAMASKAVPRNAVENVSFGLSASKRQSRPARNGTKHDTTDSSSSSSSSSTSSCDSTSSDSDCPVRNSTARAVPKLQYKPRQLVSKGKDRRDADSDNNSNSDSNNDSDNDSDDEDREQAVQNFRHKRRQLSSKRKANKKRDSGSGTDSNSNSNSNSDSNSDSNSNSDSTTDSDNGRRIQQTNKGGRVQAVPRQPSSKTKATKRQNYDTDTDSNSNDNSNNNFNNNLNNNDTTDSGTDSGFARKIPGIPGSFSKRRANRRQLYV